MEITKFRLQFSTSLEQVKAHLWQVRYRARKLTRIAAIRARRLGRELRTRENALRVLLVARFRKRIAAANSKATKVKTQLSTVFERATAHLQQAQNKLAGLKRSIAERLQKLAEERCAREDELRALLAARSREAIAATNSKITKAKTQLSIVFEQAIAHLRRAKNILAGRTKSIAKRLRKPPKELRAPEDVLREKAARPPKAIIKADNKVTKAKAQLSIVPGQWTAHLRQEQDPLAGLARSITEGPQRPPEELRVRQVAKSLEAIVEANSKVTKAKGQLSIAFKQGTARVWQAQKTLAGIGRNIVNRRRRRRLELSARESQMHELLANSPDAVAVINGDRRFVTANRRALDLFGVSERNLSKFNIDVFLFRGQIPDLRRNGSLFMGRQERHGKCTIRRFDGSMRAAEFAFVTDFLPHQHLCRFYDLCLPQRLTPVQHTIRPGTQHFSHVGQRH